MKRLNRSRGWVLKWLDRYRRLGIDGLYDFARSGRPTILEKVVESRFVNRVQNGASEKDGVSVLKAKHIRAFLSVEFGAKYSLSGVYGLLQRMNLSRIKPRPQHEKNDPELMAQWLGETLPSKVTEVKQAHPNEKIEFWFQDEMRYGNKTRIAAVWQLRGSSPSTRKQNGFQNRYIYGAVNPESGQHVGLVFSECSAEAMNIHLGLVSQALAVGSHAILIMDQAPWHSNAKTKLVVPANITILDLPPYSPELNPVERLWLWLKERHLANRIIKKSEDLMTLGCDIWKKLSTELVKSICHTEYLKPFTNFS
jgi:transposase